MSEGSVIITIVTGLAAIVQALSLFLLKQIFAELKSVRDTLRDYVPREVCEEKMTSQHYRIRNLEQHGGPLPGLLLAGGAALLLLSAGCGHNAVSYGKGFAVETTANPETWTFGFAVRYGEIFTAAVKERAKVTLTTSAKAAGTASDKSAPSDKSDTATTLTIETGDQVTGYMVDLEKVKAQASPAGK